MGNKFSGVLSGIIQPLIDGVLSILKFIFDQIFKVVETIVKPIVTYFFEEKPKPCRAGFAFDANREFCVPNFKVPPDRIKEGDTFYMPNSTIPAQAPVDRDTICPGGTLTLGGRCYLPGPPNMKVKIEKDATGKESLVYTGFCEDSGDFPGEPTLFWGDNDVNSPMCMSPGGVISREKRLAHGLLPGVYKKKGENGAQYTGWYYLKEQKPGVSVLGYPATCPKDFPMRDPKTMQCNQACNAPSIYEDQRCTIPNQPCPDGTIQASDITCKLAPMYQVERERSRASKLLLPAAITVGVLGVVLVSSRLRE